MFHRTVAALVVLFSVGGYASGQSNLQLLTVFPPGARAGSTVEITLAGSGFDGNEKLLFSAKGFTAERVGTAPAPAPKQPQPGQPPTAVKFKVTAPKDASGMYDVRVVSKSGMSNPRAFVVSDTTDVVEIEPNNDVGQAQKIEIETTVNGTISAPTDVDYVAFKAKVGQHIVVYCLTTSIDSKMQADLMVSGPDGKPLASNRGYRGGDAVLDFKAPTDGDYLVRVAQFAYTTGGPDHFYRLTVTEGDWVDALVPPLDGNGITPFTRNGPGVKIDAKAHDLEGKLQSHRFTPPTAAMIDATEHSRSTPGGNLLLTPQESVVLDNEKNGTANDAQEVEVPCDIAGRIAKKNDRHWYSFAAKRGEVWTLEVFAERIGSPVDSYFVLTDAKGKVITQQDDGADTLSPNQFYTKGDDPARYRFVVPADGTYKVMVSTREAGVQFGVRDQYVLRIAKEKPDFRLAVMPLSTHVPEAGAVTKGGGVVFAVFVFRFDGFNDAIELSAGTLPDGVKCPKQVIGPGQTRGTLVLTCAKDADEWEGFVTIYAKSGKLNHTARPFTVTWPAIGLQPNQIPNSPMITRMDRGDGLALAIRGDAPFTLTPTETEVTAKGGKVEVTLKVARDAKFKDAIQIFSATPNFGPRQQGNQPLPAVGTAQPASTEIKISVDVPSTLAPGTHTLVLRGQSAAPQPKLPGNVQRAVPTYAAVPITVIVGGTPKRK